MYVKLWIVDEKKSNYFGLIKLIYCSRIISDTKSYTFNEVENTFKLLFLHK